MNDLFDTKNDLQTPGDESHFNNEVFEVDWHETTLKRVEFSQCKFKNSNFIKTKFDSCYFDSCCFDGCNFIMTTFPGGSFNNTLITNSKASGVTFCDCGLSFSVKFSNSLLEYSSFCGMNLKYCSFVDCRMRESVFTKANMTRVKVEGCDLEGADFSRANLRQASFLRSFNYNIDITTDLTKGAVFDLPEAVSLLRRFGIIIA